ncbi:TPA: DUF551 domain-containing protein [Klebsiella pneumoniae]|nr:DUF551 domain-containing protein [Klebsiella pneumoniae]MDZ3551866.1 DUF551 domain-containing protein [Klebsiella pneumoniae]
MNNSITRERLEEIACDPMINQGSEFAMMARMTLAAMDRSESLELPLDYLQGHKDGLEWAAQLAEANHPETGDWLYDDPIELAKAIRKGPDMPPAQPAPVVDADDNFYSWFGREWAENYQHNQYTTAAKQMLGVMAESAWKAGRRAAMLQASPVCTCPSGDGSLRWPCPVHPGNSPVIPDCWCRTCRPVVLNDMRFVVCPDCGNKRCPRANDHRNACTGSNEPGQEGSAYPDTTQSPGSEPATVPGKWIPVSERMPEREVDVQVYCPDKKEQMVAYLERNELEGYFRFATWRTGDGIYCQPTHWMPLPAAPQEVK